RQPTRVISRDVVFAEHEWDQAHQIA
ncbi:hypothetical protein D039_2787B, partial [Vibrio parahaemolyticus EKP-028]